MADRGAPQLGRFHFKCSKDVSLSLDGKIAQTEDGFGIAFSKEPIPIGRNFSVKVLEPSSYGVS